MAVEGLGEVKKAFDNLQKGGQIRVLRSSLNAALIPVVKALRLSAPKGTESHRTYKGRTVAPGFLHRKGIVKSVRVSKDKTRVFGNARLAGEAWYGSMINHGWRTGKRSEKIKRASRREKGGLSAGRLKDLGDKRVKKAGNNWFTNTIKDIENKTMDAYSAKVRATIIKEWLK